MSVHIIIYGKGKPLVLFHGWGFNTEVWSPLLPALTSQYELHLVDLPGFGLTQPMAWEAFKTTLLKQLPENFALAGWSMGGLFATRLAIEEPERVTHLVNIASSPRFIREEGWPGVDREMFKAFYKDLADDHEQTLERFIELQLQGQTRPLVMGGQAPSMLSLQTGLDILINWDLRLDLFLLNMPVLYMFGRLDAITPRKTMGIMQTMYPQFNYTMFPKAAHMPFLSHPDEVIPILERFIP